MDHFDLDGMSMDDLRTLNHRVVAKLRQRASINNTNAAIAFSMGDLVWFLAGARKERVEGVVSKVKRTNICVQTTTPNGQRGPVWNVSAGLCTRLTSSPP